MAASTWAESMPTTLGTVRSAALATVVVVVVVGVPEAEVVTCKVTVEPAFTLVPAAGVWESTVVHFVVPAPGPVVV